MARVTVEDCVDKVDSRFELVVLASKRARQISGGAPLTVVRDRDKNTVVALREIAEETVSLDGLKEDLISSYRKPVTANTSEASSRPDIDFLTEAGGVQVDDSEAVSEDLEASVESEDTPEVVDDGVEADFSDENIEEEKA